jgi:hypothetical protein
VAGFLAQIALAFYRGYVQFAPAWMGVVLAPFFLLPLGVLKVQARRVRIALQTIGWVFLCVGLFAIWGAFANPVMSLVERISLPLFLLSLGGLTALPRLRATVRVAVLVVLVIATAGVQLAATIEAFHEREMREQGVLAHWH